AQEALAEVVVCQSVRLRPTYEILRGAIASMALVDKRRIKRRDLAALDDRELGLVLSVLNRNDAPLGADRSDGGIVLYRGEPRRPAIWRLVHEITHPIPSKRQAFSHTLGRVPRGVLRAPPGGMAETTRTLVPGERVLSEQAGGWGRHLPL